VIFNIAPLLALLTMGALLFVVVWRWPLWGVLAPLCVASLLDLLQIGSGGVDVGVSLYIDDIACVVSLGVGILVYLRYWGCFPRDAVPCFALLILVAICFGRGLSTYGLKLAGNSVRDLFSFAAPALAVMLLRPALRLDASRLARWLVGAGLCLSAIAMLRWAGVLPTPVELEDNLRVVSRTLGADYAMIIGQAFIAAIYLAFAERGNRWWWAGAGLLGLVTLGLQHRSVWAGTAAGIAWLTLRSGRIVNARRLAYGAVCCAVAGTVMFAIPQVSDGAVALISSNVEETQAENSTWAWRVSGYEEAAARIISSEPVDLLIGSPAGWADGAIASFASTHIHSRYVDTLAYYGMVGFMALLMWLWILARTVRGPMRRLHGKTLDNRAPAVFLEALLLSEAVYFVPYTGGILNGVLLGLIWLAAIESNKECVTMRFEPRAVQDIREWISAR